MNNQGERKLPLRPSAMQPLAGRVGYIVCAFTDESARERACRALQAAEFDASDLSRLDTRQIGERLARDTPHDGACSSECGQRLDLKRHWLDPAANEQAWLLVRTSSDRQLLVAQLLLRTEPAGRTVHFGPMWMEDPATGP